MLLFFEMGVSLDSDVSVCILLWDLVHASFGEGADLSSIYAIYYLLMLLCVSLPLCLCLSRSLFLSLSLSLILSLSLSLGVDPKHSFP